jgi:hypothetical protein
MINALNSGAFQLQTEEMKGMVNYVMNMFNRFINSNETMRLDKSFSVYFKVLSMDHVNYPHHRRKAIVGCHNPSCISRKRKGWQIIKVWLKLDLIRGFSTFLLVYNLMKFYIFGIPIKIFIK